MLKSLKERLRHLMTETHALYFAARHPETPWYAKLFVAGVVAYAFSPIDLIPDFVPVIGYLDDLILIPLGIAVAIKLIPAGVMAECRARARDAAATGKPVNRTAAVVVVGIWVLVAALCTLWAYEAFAESRPPLVPNGLEFGNVAAIPGVASANPRRISFQFTLRNVGKTNVTILTRNLQAELWNYKDSPQELHITISALPVRNGQEIHSPLAHHSPVSLKPGESVELKQDFVDRKGMKSVALVYDMLNSTSEKYATWRGRIRSSVVSVPGN